jgi:hypothetical protein
VLGESDGYKTGMKCRTDHKYSFTLENSQVGMESFPIICLHINRDLNPSPGVQTQSGKLHIP